MIQDKDTEGFRLEALDGQLVNPVDWIGPSHLMADWMDPVNPAEGFTYLVNLATSTGSLRRLAIVESLGSPIPGPKADTERAIVPAWSPSTPGPRNVSLLNMSSGELQTIYDVDPTVPQWAKASDHTTRFGETSYIDAKWLGDGENAFVFTLMPKEPYTNLPEWGKILVVDLVTQQVHVLAEEGRVAATFPDGNLLVQNGWVDGKLQLFTPPYTNTEPTEVTPSNGQWLWGWAASPDGQKVAWLELTPPPGDWSQRIPTGCCGGGPAPDVKALAIWDRRSGSIQRFPVSDLSWRTHLYWRKDSSALLFAGYPTDAAHQNATFQTVLFQMTLDGHISTLATHDWDGMVSIRAEGSDGSLYYDITGHTSQNDDQLTRRYPDGKLEILREGIPQAQGDEYFTDTAGRWITVQNGVTTIQNLNTGETRQVTIPQGIKPILSPDSNWAAYLADDHTVRIAKVKLVR